MLDLFFSYMVVSLFFSGIAVLVNFGFAIPAAFFFCLGLMEGIVWAAHPVVEE